MRVNGTEMTKAVPGDLPVSFRCFVLRPEFSSPRKLLPGYLPVTVRDLLTLNIRQTHATNTFKIIKDT